jgi:adenylate cyclase
VSEVGKYKSEIAYHGDVLNTTARMLSQCHDLNAEFIISDYILEKIEMPKYLQAESLGSFQMKGKQQAIDLYALSLSVNKDAIAKRQKRSFRRRSQKI